MAKCYDSTSLELSKSFKDFCESTFAESRDREWDFSKKFVRAENENESSRGKMRVENENESSEEKESWELVWDSWIFKNTGLI